MPIRSLVSPSLVVCALLVAAGLSGCATEPYYAVRPGEPRAEIPPPRPAYPVARTSGDDQSFARTDRAAPAAPTASRAPAPVSAGSDDAPAPFRPEPIRPDAADDRGVALRGRQAPGPVMPIRSAPPPALETPSQVTVRPGESLFEVAERVRTPIRAIIDLNGLQPPYDVAPGAVLRIPPPVVYTVRAGDSLIGVARRFSIDPRSLANLNDIQLETALKPGQRLALPSLVTDKGPTAAATGPSFASTNAGSPTRRTPSARPPIAAAAPVVAAAAAAPTATAGMTPAPVAPIAKPVTTRGLAIESEPDASPSMAQAAAAGKGKFVWPVKGEVLSSYGPKGPGQRNDGVNIAANTGDPVKAAAGGQVVYAGNSVPGFGNLVVIKHPDGWTSLYGNLGKIDVKIRADVAQGQPIGSAGISGAVDKPQVHFELRYASNPAEKARPLDPASLLP